MGGDTTGALRFDGNLAYAFTQIVNIKGGLNFSKLTSGTNVDKLNPAIGFQGGVGVQVTRNFGIDVGYTQMNQTGIVNDINLDLKESGLEIGLYFIVDQFVRGRCRKDYKFIESSDERNH